MLSGHQRITWRRNIAENFNRLSRVHKRYRRQTTDRQTDGRRQIANVNMSSRSLKTVVVVVVVVVVFVVIIIIIIVQKLKNSTALFEQQQMQKTDNDDSR